MIRRWFQNHPRALAAAGFAGLLAVLSVRFLSAESPAGAGLVRASYNSSYALFSPWQTSLGDSPVVIIYLDPDSYRMEQQDPAQPWSRALHAKLVRRLTQAQARAVVFDVVFSDPGPDPAADRDFAEAIRANGRVVLAGELSGGSRATWSEPGVKSLQFTPPEKQLLSAAAGWGLANVIVDDDFVVRKHFAGFDPQEKPSLTWAAARMLDLPVTRGENPSDQNRWLRYYGRPITVIPHVSYSQALDQAGVPDSFFRGKVVFVGARPITGGFKERRDEFRSPYHSWAKDLFQPAVEVHATQMLNLLRRDWLQRLSPIAETGLLALAAVLFSAGFFRFRPVTATGLALVGEGMVMGLAALAFTQGRLWLPWLVVAAVQIPAALGGSALYHTLDWIRQRRRFESLRRAAEQKIKEQAALIDKAQDAILVQDLDGGIIYANPSAERLYGWTAAELGRAAVARPVFAPSQTQMAEAAQAVRERGEWGGELEQITRSGEKRLVESRWTLIKDEHGQPKSILLINTDVTEKRRLEAQFLRVQRMETIGSLAGGMAHDLNSALSPVLMGIQLIRRKPQDEETREMLAVMEANTQRGAQMVRQVLTFSRGKEGERELVDVQRLLREMENILRQTLPRSITAAVMAPADLWPVRANPTQVHQVLLNLCVNARDAMPKGGQLTLAADNVDLNSAEAKGIPDAAPGQYVMLLVSDTGTGIAPEALPRIFEPFFTTKDPGQGTGLGLVTLARIVRSHDGFVSVKSELGSGSTFEVYLPRALTTPVPVRIGAEVEESLRGHGELILVVEEDRVVREMMASSLAEYGYRALSAPDAPEALSLLGQHQGGVRVVLTNVSISTEPTLALPASRPAIILMCGESEVAAEPLPPGVAARLPKPFGLEQLLAVLAHELH